MFVIEIHIPLIDVRIKILSAIDCLARIEGTHNSHLSQRVSTMPLDNYFFLLTSYLAYNQTMLPWIPYPRDFLTYPHCPAKYEA